MKYIKIYILLLLCYSSLLHSSLYDIRCNNIAIQSNNQLVTTGFVLRSTNDLAFITSRYNVDGSLDTAFGTGGTVVTQFTSSTASRAFSNAIQSDQKCVVAGSTIISNVSQVAVARYTTAGVLDTTFNATGTVNISINDGANAQAILVQPSNQFIVTAGSTMSGGQTRVLLTRFNTTGALDTGFNGSGIVNAVIGEHSQANAVIMGPSNTIIIAGFAVINGQRQVLLARFTSGGVLDSTFGTGGITTTAFGTDDYATGVALLGSGQIMVSGQTNTTAFVARYSSAGVIDTTYGSLGNGAFLLNATGQTTSATAIAIQSADSKAVVTGYSDGQLLVARLLTTGALDTSFNTIGYRLTPLGGESLGMSILVQPDGDVVSAGNFDQSSFLQRLLTGGGFDTSFSQNGVATQPQGLPSPTFFGNCVVVDKIYGNDITGKRNWAPFQTINGALAAALPGDTCYIMPGTYNENGVIIPDNVSVKGLSQSSVIISWNATSNISLVTMGNNTSIENVTIQLTSLLHISLNGVVFENTAAQASYVKDCLIIVDNSLAPDSGNSEIGGILNSGSGLPPANLMSVEGCTIKLRSTALGNKNGIVVSAAGGLNVRDTSIDVAAVAGSGVYYGVRTQTNASAQCNVITSMISGSTADINQTLGTITLTESYLVNSNANGGGFTTVPYPKQLFFGVQGGTAITPGSGSRYLNMGSVATATFAANTNPIPFVMSQNTIVNDLAFRARASAQSGTTPGTFTVQRNGVDTALNLVITGTIASAINNTTSVRFLAGDTLTIRYATSGGVNRTLTDFCVTVDLY